MKRFADHILREATESTEKRIHIEHLEDCLFDGPEGVKFALRILKEFGNTLSDPSMSTILNISVKWDGSPAIVFGPDPVDGRFFVATKAAFSVTPKLAKTHEDIDELYQNRPIADILHIALSELSTLHPGLVIQGDVLFTRDTKRLQTIDGIEYLTFQPNTILYAIEPNTDLGRKVAAAEMGLALHTTYIGTGTTLAQSSAVNLSPETFASLRHTDRVFLLDANFDDVSGTVSFTPEESADFQLALDTASSSAVGVALYDTIIQEPLHTYLHKFINYTVRQGWDLVGRDAVDNFLVYLLRLQENAVSQMKTLQGQQGQQRRFAVVRDMVIGVSDLLVDWFDLHRAIAQAKTVIIRKLEGLSADFKTFAKSSEGWVPTGPEGFVVSTSQKAVKLVDRQNFSKANFLRSR